jgi:anaerobic selenocysteine-containing dehydrogenase
MDAMVVPIMLLRTNQPDGLDCPRCAWPDKEHRSTFQFCENGAKPVTWEATKKRVTPEFFAAHTVTLLLEWNDYQLDGEGRLTHPMSRRVSGLLGGKLCALSPHTLEDFV